MTKPTRNKYFIRCIGGTLPVSYIYALKGGVPHRLNHPSSNDKDTFTGMRAVRAQLSSASAAALRQRYTLVPTPLATTVATLEGETK